MRIYHPTIDEADRFPQAMIEGSSEFDWDELPDHLKDVLRGAARAVNEWAAQQENPIVGEVVPDAGPALPQADLRPHLERLAVSVADQAYIVECEDLEPGDKIWFPNLFELEQDCGPFPSCCVPKPVGPDYDGPKWVPE